MRTILTASFALVVLVAGSGVSRAQYRLYYITDPTEGDIIEGGANCPITAYTNDSNCASLDFYIRANARVSQILVLQGFAI
ncbi:MAG TPA: hypothetical protein VG406_30030 [Isosphaeraceae bacterium]|jgi:hypothetical protein|nr:hypothetical protein [Isosphaeraceae bacterium]